MAILVKGEITITKGFKTWKEMVYAQFKWKIKRLTWNKIWNYSF